MTQSERRWEFIHPKDPRRPGRIEEIGPFRGLVVHMPHFDQCRPGVIEANAVLIAAAPQLLDALRIAEAALLAAYGEPADINLESAQGRKAIIAARSAIRAAGGAA